MTKKNKRLIKDWSKRKNAILEGKPTKPDLRGLGNKDEQAAYCDRMIKAISRKR